MGDLNVKVGSDSILLVHVMGKRGLGDRNDNATMFVDFCNFISGTLFEYRACQKVSWISADRHLTSNQIDHFIIKNKFRSCLMDVANMRDANIDLERDHYLMVAYVLLPLLPGPALVS